MKKSMLLLALICGALFCVTSESNAQQVIKLFNGKNLSNWDFIVDKNAVPADQVYSVKDGMIHIAGNPFGYMYTKEKYDNFKLHVEWRWPQEATNSGIFLLIEDVKNPFPNGIECQLAAGNAGDFVCLGGSDLVEFLQRPGEARPAFPVVKKANPSSEKPVGEWNEANIFVKNGTITVYINGVYQNTGNNKVKSGHIGLQSEGKDIQFRNVTLTKW
ncbi:hypothetical protein M2459_000149 [Parabacteroides sp. PF5-5]|uniref:3-keto-disaccharide hydrolase n=1 Tax=unclassified Parabacteroides TaxID=2649774 RepID=UPI0024745F51|nr:MULTISPECIES: DUF1080 domain-containing protein [unclassified Parabacteroides]MDH6303817.1 hypothetical protein [Parabacteroides sp. PH5-39]MDH6314434.1 hypothetical protein [Parabacteroides sp. PF5-13]MDH6318501.1 hypothetical protein [Parabacteroides sp. PH5-13]MDH6322206.1 hypothetical protein [Parabacteroides sp. PH5-8]MDH6325714.1 hypothetical protein [Parabacteroides sp. PH5-41]